MRTHFYKFIFIVISLCALATTNAWAKYVYIDVTRLQFAKAPANYPGYDGKYYMNNLRVHYGGGAYVEVDSNTLQQVHDRKIYKVAIPDNSTTWQISTKKKTDGTNYFYHPTNAISYTNSETYVNKYIIKEVAYVANDSAVGEVAHMIGLVTGGLIYFDNSKTNWSAPIQMVIGHGSYARTYDLKQITGTDLWYVNLTNTDARWPDATYFAFINTQKAHILGKTTPEQAVLGGEGHGGNYKNTDIYRTQTELANGQKYLFVPSTKNDKTPITCQTNIPNFTITQNVKIRDYEGADYKTITNNFPATFTLTTHTLNTGDTTAVAATKTGTSTLTSQSVYAGSTTFSYTNLTETETNFEFDGWGTGKPTATGNSYPNNYSQETTMYAFFTKKYQLTFSAQTGGTVTAKAGNTQLTSGNHVVGGQITLTATPNTGYYFVKWVDANDTQLSTSENYTHTLSADITIKAVFNNTYIVNLNNQDATTAGTTEVTATYGSPMPAITPPIRTGYTFGGYWTGQNGTGTQYYNGTGTSKTNWNIASDTTLYAQWSPNTNTAYTVNHYQQNVDDSYPTTPTETQNLTGTTATSVSPAVKSYTGFTAPSTQTVTIAADGSTVVNYQYTRNSYTLTWNLDGGTISSAGTAAGAVKYGATLTPPTVTRVGYTFDGWSPSVPATMPADHSTYTAQWNFAMEYSVTGSAVVTSAKGKTVKATNTLTLQVSNMPVGTTVAISAPNITFYNEAGNVVTTLTTTSNPQSIPLTLAYTPTADNTTEQPTITLDVLNHKKTFTNLISCRSLPATFAIVAKVGNIWYALPSQGLNSETTPVGYPVKVDNNDNPIAVTSLPTKAEWALRNVYKVNGPYDRFAANGENLVFVNAENKTLYASKDNANIQTYAEYTNYATTNPDRYEWVPTTTDLTNYTLKNVGRDKDLSINVNATFGTHASNVASSNLRFLPINATYTPFDMQVVEWYPTKVLVQTEAALTTVSAIVGDIEVASPVVTKKGGKLYEISGLPLESNPTKILTISYDTYSCSKVIPIIISRATKSVTDAPFTTLTTSVYNYSDLVVRDGATLTINGTKQAPDKFVNVTIYPTAKIVVPENKQLSVYSLTFFGGIDDIYNGSTYELNKYGVPQLSLKGTLGKTVTTIDYLMRVDSKQMYSLTVPYDVQLADIKYWDGSDIELGNALYISAYNGESRAQNRGNGNNWIYETDFASKLGAAILKAGVGYTISAELQSGVGASYSILRLPMTSNLANEASETAKQVAVTAHGIDAQVSDNHKGWNLVGNPYMASIKGADDDDLVLGYLQETGTGPWEWVEKTYRYVTIPSDNGEWYEQKKFAEATLPPFKNFFVQIGTTGDLQFGLGTRQSMPARYLQQEQAPREVEFELLLSNEAQSDNMGLLISEEYTPAYEINADLEKMLGTMSVYSIYNGYQLAYNALSPLNAMEEIPLGYVVPATGEYSFTLDERGDFDQIEHIYLLDHEMNITTDLLDDIYTFTATDKKSDKRFAISVILKAEEEVETPTQLETLEWESDHPYKFIYQDKMYIMQNGVIYDAMGKQVQTINK